MHEISAESKEDNTTSFKPLTVNKKNKQKISVRKVPRFCSQLSISVKHGFYGLKKAAMIISFKI